MFVSRFSSIILIISLCFVSMPECSAASAISLAKQALEVTSGFDRPLIGGNIEKAQELYTEYKAIYDKLHKFLQEPPKNTWGSELGCVRRAGSIVNMRRIVLMDYIIMIDALQRNQNEEYNSIRSKLYRDWRSVNEWRRIFYRKYGF